MRERMVRVAAHEARAVIISATNAGRNRRVTACMQSAARWLLSADSAEAERAVTTFYEKCQKKEMLEVPYSNLIALGRELLIPDPEKFAGALISQSSETIQLPSGNASCAEIEVLVWGKDLLRPPEDPKRYAPTSQYVSVFVDEVMFRQKDKETDRVEALWGQYVRIAPPAGTNHGAVVLIVDAQSGDVLLVSQYRHPQRRFLTETVRGFGTLGYDKNEMDTALREMEEEAGVVPLGDARGGLELHRLRRLYTDTGKLTEAPHYFLAYVERAHQTMELNRGAPLMEDPVWIPLATFYRAVRSDRAIALKSNEATPCLTPENKRQLNARTPIDEGRLEIEDAFTCLAAFLAEPMLRARFAEAFQDR